MAKVAKLEKAPESGEARFARLAVYRVNAAIKRIDMVGNLSAYGYKSTQEQRDKVVAALTNAVMGVKAKLEKTEKRPEPFAL